MRIRGPPTVGITRVCHWLTFRLSLRIAKTGQAKARQTKRHPSIMAALHYFVWLDTFLYKNILERMARAATTADVFNAIAGPRREVIAATGRNLQT